MPIDPNNYPSNWEEISRRIRERDGHKCKFCGVPQYAVGWRDWRGAFVPLKDEQMVPAGEKSIRIVLTVAHLNHDTQDNIDENLAALCQRCHLLHDQDHHIRHAAETRRQNQLRAGQMQLGLEELGTIRNQEDAPDDGA